jgi:hypothetical protein
MEDPMSDNPRLPYATMKLIADALWDYFAGTVALHDIAGSVRRLASYPTLPKGADCGDIELVLDADRQTILAKLMASPSRFKQVTGGERLIKCEMHLTGRGKPLVVAVQLNLATTLHTLEWGTVNNYGWKYFLATGDADWNRLMVLDYRAGGLKPPTIRFVEGRTSGFLHINNTPQHTPTEQAVFDLYGLPHVEPHRRNEVTARELRVALAGQGVL